jgi:hypothetical protein
MKVFAKRREGGKDRSVHSMQRRYCHATIAVLMDGAAGEAGDADRQRRENHRELSSFHHDASDHRQPRCSWRQPCPSSTKQAERLPAMPSATKPKSKATLSFRTNASKHCCSD